ncbi:MAG: helix-turn-helix domain-containing protein [Candidatus Omnitrophota bacterium]|jgi:two-component system nitrogen regulation response regulator GlnG
MENKITKEEKGFGLINLIREFEDFFMKSKQEDLYEFVIQAVEKPLIERILERTFGNQIKAAKILGINRNTLRTKIKKLDIRVEKWKF